MFNKGTYFIFLFITGMFCLTACQLKPMFEQTKIFQEHQWAGKDSLQFDFQIDDTTKPYTILFVIRHHNAYHYKNIWVDCTIQDPSGNKTPASYNIYLADENKGWLGTGMGDIYDQRIAISNTPFVFKKGKYTISLRQSMREDPLLGVLAAGIRVEKVLK